MYGGTGRLYIPQPDKLMIPIRDRLIRDEFNGSNVYALLAKMWNLSEDKVRQIVREKQNRSGARTTGWAVYAVRCVRKFAVKSQWNSL